ncbi:MAG: amidohydrolase [Anaerolinea sp.]
MIDLILTDGRIYTQTGAGFVEAVAIARGRIVAIGTTQAMLALRGARTTVENLRGRTVLPGLIDAHVHYYLTARALNEVDVFEVPSLDVALERVAARASSAQPGQWITGRGWAQGLWASGAFPTAADLDRVAPNNPVYLRAKSGHAGWANSAALAACGVTASTSDPDGGEIVRDPRGNPTGILLETAMRLIEQQISAPTVDQLADMMLAAQAQFHAQGLTGLHDYDDPICMMALQRLRERGQLGLRVHKNVNRAWLDHALELGVRANFGDDWLKIGALKMFADGALGPKTALMLEPYHGEPDNCGIAVLTSEEMYESMSKASAHGLPTTIHAIGDRAFREVCNVMERVRAEEAARGQTPDQLRHRVEHVQIIHPDDRYRLRDLKVIASMQPTHATSDYPVAERYWGERCAWAYNARWQLDQGVIVAFGSDSPVERFNPFEGIAAAVTRQKNGQPEGGWYPEMRLTVEEAIAGFTTGAAYASYQEDRLGRLDVGYYADLVVLDRDIFTTPAHEIDRILPVATMIEGRWRFGGLD